MRKYISQEILLFLLCFAIVVYFQTSEVLVTQAQIKPSISMSLRVPSQLTAINQTTLEMPDWSLISFSSFPKIESESSLEVDGESRIWKRGATPDVFLKLQDIGVLYPNLLNLSNIMNESSLLNISLAQFPLVGAQTIEHLINIVPGLGKTRVKSVAPIYALFKYVLKEDIAKVADLAINDLKSFSPELETLTLNLIDLSLYSIGSINNIEFVALSQFKNWEKAYINQIPGLNKLPLSAYPVPVLPQGEVIGTVKRTWGEKDSEAKTAISGSYKVGFNNNCLNSNCSNIELKNIKGEKLPKTAFWVNSKQLVEGGNGCLSKVNGGKEPTGRNPYGSLFKVVVDKIDEVRDKASLALYFRFSNWCGSTPYVVGPIALEDVGIDSVIFLGSDQGENVISSSYKVELPTKQEMNAQQPDNLINTQFLAKVIANNNNSDYDRWSDYLVAGYKKGRILGLYSFRSYSSLVITAISSQPGGDDWLKSLNQGKEINATEMSKYFPPALQDNLFEDYLSELIDITQKETDPHTNTTFSVNLLYRVIEKVYFGSKSLTYSGSAEYINNLVNNYQNAKE